MILIVVKCDAYGEVDDEDDDHTDVESPEAYIQKKRSIGQIEAS